MGGFQLSIKTMWFDNNNGLIVAQKRGKNSYKYCTFVPYPYVRRKNCTVLQERKILSCTNTADTNAVIHY